MTDDLVAWLRTQIDEDEAAAQAASPGPWAVESENPDGGWAIDWNKDGSVVEVVGSGHVGGGAWEHADAQHIARWDPARALREVAAKRRMIDALAEAETNHGSYITATYTTNDALKDLAAVYADRPGWKPEWAPS